MLPEWLRKLLGITILIRLLRLWLISSSVMIKATEVLVMVMLLLLVLVGLKVLTSRLLLPAKEFLRTFSVLESLVLLDMVLLVDCHSAQGLLDVTVRSDTKKER